ncbi:MAG TPA: RNA methyltransferase [Candidatus Angelobacter sp.]|nr:RNA methyltransferase [Candidatus Angelobacter sp.]
MPVQNEARLRPVSSRQNAQVKDLRKAFSQAEPTREGYIAIEGIRLIEEAIRSGLRFQTVFFSESGRVHSSRLLPQIASHAEALLLPDEVFLSAVATETPQGVAALVKPKTVRLEEILGEHSKSDPDLLLLGLAGVQDPGNVGTVIRSAEAFSARAVLLGEKTANHFNSKVVRASAGSVFREPVIRVSWAEAVTSLKEHGVRMVATSSHKGQSLDEIDLTGPLALLIGGEGSGLPPAVAAHSDELVTIPHSPRVESLNAGIAASILLYEAARRKGSGDRVIGRKQ